MASLNPLEELLPEPPPDIPRFEWGQVVTVNPTRVELDSSENSIDVSSVVSGLAVGARVFVVIHGRSATILGKAAV